MMVPRSPPDYAQVFECQTREQTTSRAGTYQAVWAAPNMMWQRGKMNQPPSRRCSLRLSPQTPGLQLVLLKVPSSTSLAGKSFFLETEGTATWKKKEVLPEGGCLGKRAQGQQREKRRRLKRTNKTRHLSSAS